MRQEKFKTGLLAQSEEFKKQVSSLTDEFNSKGPFSSGLSTSEAFENIANIRTQLQALKEQEQTLRKGLNIFKIDQPPSKEISALEKVSVSLGWDFCESVCGLGVLSAVLKSFMTFSHALLSITSLIITVDLQYGVIGCSIVLLIPRSGF